MESNKSEEYRQKVIASCDRYNAIAPLDDGSYCFWVKDRGALSASALRVIADELDRRSNAPVDAVVHTPGPWVVIETTGLARHLANVTVISSGGLGGVHLAEVYDSVTHATDLIGTVESNGNAQLIAAAPDLLAACQAFIDCDNQCGANLAFVMAKNAIEKATGERS